MYCYIFLPRKHKNRCTLRVLCTGYCITRSVAFKPSSAGATLTSATNSSHSCRQANGTGASATWTSGFRGGFYPQVIRPLTCPPPSNPLTPRPPRTRTYYTFWKNICSSFLLPCPLCSSFLAKPVAVFLQMQMLLNHSNFQSILIILFGGWWYCTPTIILPVSSGGFTYWFKDTGSESWIYKQGQIMTLVSWRRTFSFDLICALLLHNSQYYHYEDVGGHELTHPELLCCLCVLVWLDLMYLFIRRKTCMNKAIY